MVEVIAPRRGAHVRVRREEQRCPPEIRWCRRAAGVAKAKHSARRGVERSDGDTGGFVPTPEWVPRGEAAILNERHWGKPKRWEWRPVIKAAIVRLPSGGRRGQEGGSVLFPRQGPRCIAAARRPRVFGRREGEKKEIYNNKPQRPACLSVCKHVEQRGICCL